MNFFQKTIKIGLYITMILVQAGAGGLPAGANLSIVTNKILSDSDLLQQYWAATDLNMQQVKQIISNKQCNSSEKYRTACISSLVQVGIRNNLVFSEKLGALHAAENKKSFFEFEEKTEKQLVKIYQNNKEINFDLNLDLLKSNSKKNQASLAADLLNAFYSVYRDPHTYLLPAKYYEEQLTKKSRNKNSIGLSFEREAGKLIVKKIVKNSDADLAEVKINDQLLAINDVELKDLNSAEVVDLLKADQQNFKIKVARQNKTQEISFTKSQREIKYIYGTSSEHGGYIYVGKFAVNTCNEVQELILDLNKSKVENVVLDLRNNPGGLLSEAVCVAGLFLGPNKLVYQAKYLSNQDEDEAVFTEQEQVFKGQLAVLVNGFSASASELLAGALQYYKRSIVVGSVSFGKGTFQEPEDWPLANGVKIFKTKGFYLLPNGRSTQLVGVIPDVVVDEGVHIKREVDLFYSAIDFSKYFDTGKAAMGRSKVGSLPLVDSSNR